MYEGRWRKLENTVSQAGSIHDDRTARAMGFPGGFVPGNVLGQALMPAIVQQFGALWFEGCWFTIKFVAPVYEHDEVHEVIVADGDGSIDVNIVNREGRACSPGSAGLGAQCPWNSAVSADAEAVLQELPLGSTFELSFNPTFADVERVLAAAGDETPWFRDKSPWGAPIAPPELLMSMALRNTHITQLEFEGARKPAIWAEQAFSVRQPMPYDQEYRLVERVADKGRAGRTVYLTFEFEVRDGSDALFAVARHKLKWFSV